MATNPFREYEANGKRKKLAMLVDKKEQLDATINMLVALRKPTEVEVPLQILIDARSEIEEEIKELSNDL